MGLICFLRQEMHNQYSCSGFQTYQNQPLETISFFVHYAEKPSLTVAPKPNAVYCLKQNLLQSIVCGVYRGKLGFSVFMFCMIANLSEPEKVNYIVIL